MKATALLLALVSTSAALDIYLRKDKVCQGSAEVCTNINPNTCCGKHFPALPRPGNGPKWWGSVGFRENIWTIDTRGHDYNGAGSCGGVKEGRRESARYSCLGGVPGDSAYYGGGYGIVGKKREVQIGPQKCVEPDRAVFHDGEGWHEYNLTTLSLERRFEM